MNYRILSLFTAVCQIQPAIVPVKAIALEKDKQTVYSDVLNCRQFVDCSLLDIMMETDGRPGETVKAFSGFCLHRLNELRLDGLATAELPNLSPIAAESSHISQIIAVTREPRPKLAKLSPDAR